jgi:hypothetical protein
VSIYGTGSLLGIRGYDDNCLPSQGLRSHEDGSKRELTDLGDIFV